MTAFYYSAVCVVVIYLFSPKWMQVSNITMWQQLKPFKSLLLHKVLWSLTSLWRAVLSHSCYFYFWVVLCGIFFILSSRALNFRNIFKSIEVFPFPAFSPTLINFTGLCLRKSSWKSFSLELQGVFRETSARSTDLQNLLGSSHWCESRLCNAAGWDGSALEMKSKIQFGFHKHRCKEVADTEMMLKC